MQYSLLLHKLQLICWLNNSLKWVEISGWAAFHQYRKCRNTGQPPGVYSRSEVAKWTQVTASNRESRCYTWRHNVKAHHWIQHKLFCSALVRTRPIFFTEPWTKFCPHLRISSMGREMCQGNALENTIWIYSIFQLAIKWCCLFLMPVYLDK